MGRGMEEWKMIAEEELGVAMAATVVVARAMDQLVRWVLWR